jgi:Putative DNA-binding domain
MNAFVASPVAVTQHAFVSALLDPDHAVPAGVRVDAGIDPQRRFAVHRNNVVVALVDVLAAAFPVTQALVGEAFFRAMARERLRIDPPCSPIVTEYGAGFAEFIAGFAPAADVPYLADMARLEWLRAQAYHAADAMPVSTDAYLALLNTPARLADTCVTLHPACHWLHSDYAVHSIWNAHQRVDDPGDADLGAIRIDAPEDVLVMRPQWDVQVTALPVGGITWLDALRDGWPLGAALARVADGDAAWIQSLLQLIIRHQLVIQLD